VLGVPARRGHSTARFGAIRQPWLREAVKRWSRFRLGSGYAFLTVATGTKSLARFSAFLDDRHRGLPDHTALTRAVLEDYLTWIASRPIAVNTRSLDLSFVKVFLDWARRHRSLPGLPDSAVIYEEEVSRPDDALPRFIPEFVMAQLESETNLARIRNPSFRHLVVVLIETGLRGGDACELPFNPMFDDSVGAPCLRFHNSKVS
jgi:site-specific recombinase XerD